MIGIGEPALLSETTGALHAFNIPLVSVMPQPLPPLTASGGGESGRGGKGGRRGGNGAYNNILTTAPDMAGQARVSSSIIFPPEIPTLVLKLCLKPKRKNFDTTQIWCDKFINSGFIFDYKTGKIGLMMSRIKLSKHILHKDIEIKFEEVGQ